MKKTSLVLCAVVISLFLIPHADSQENNEVNYIWALKAGGLGYDHAHCITTDSSNNVYITGFFEDTAEFEHSALTVTGNNFCDIFLAKYSHKGELEWVFKMGGNQVDEGLAITCDQNDNIIITGYFSGYADFGGIILTSAGERDIFLAKFDTEGKVLWARPAGGGREDTGYSVKNDSMGNILIGGSFMDTADFSGTKLYAAGASDIFLAKYNPDGDLIWVRQAGGKGYDHAYSLAVNQQDGLYITGYFKAAADFGTITLDSYGDRDIFIAKYTSNGECEWARQAGGIYWDYGYSLTVDPENNILVTGFFYEEALFEQVLVNAVAQNDIFLAKYDPSGHLIWIKQAGGPSYDRGKSLITDKTGNIFVIGHFKQSIRFEETELLAENQYYNIFIAKYSGSGEFSWVKQLGTDGLWNDGSSITLDSFGSLYIAGSFTGVDEPLTFKNITLYADHFDVFFAKLGKVKKKIIFK